VPEESILPQIFLPIVSGLFVAGYGIHKETQYVGAVSIAVTVGNVIITLFFTPITTISFFVWLAISVFGVIVISHDVHKQYKNPYVAFFLGSKTIGSITIFLGFTTNNWVMPVFEPVFSLITSHQELELPKLQLEVLVHLLGVGIILGIVQIIGRIVKWWRND